MKLLGTKIERNYREQLICSFKFLYEDTDKRRILSALNRNFPDIKTAYTLDFIYEQGEDIHKILINSDVVAIFEVDRLDVSSEPLIESISLREHKKNLSKIGRIKLAVALDLVRLKIGG
ncbi:MAG: hypothetical protein KTR21_04385 [Rhodobacteraceae bacterium]|nr:hypothetical protein [Paracoccaceae bacterium]